MTATILDDLVDPKTLAEKLRCSTRTLMRYEHLPDGLPSLLIGGRKFYRVSSVMRWLEARERHPNQTRRGARA